MQLIPSIKRLAALSLAVAGITSVLSRDAEAGAYLTVDLLGRVQGSGVPYASSVAAMPGDVIDYAVQFQLAPEGTTTAFITTAGAATLKTITNWIPSNPAGSPTSGLHSLAFDLWQPTAAGALQVNFSSGIAGTTTLGDSWAYPAGFIPGTVTPRGNGSNDLKNIQLIRGLNSFDGIAANPDGPGEIQPQVIAGTGSFSVSSTGDGSYVNIGPTNADPLNLLAGIRWRDADNTRNYVFTPNAKDLQASILGGDPVVAYHNLFIHAPLDFSGENYHDAVPEPASLSLLSIGAIGVLSRRRR